MDRKTLVDRKYIDSEVWKCSKSPTGAHHWKELQGEHLHTGMWYCKYCYDGREFPINYEQGSTMVFKED